jgi:Fe-S cluster assembly iron-binding protein IscA
MLQCTPTAAATLDEVRRQNDLPEGFGIRVAPTRSSEGEIGLSISFAEAPIEGDQVTHQHGATLMVAPEISDQLDEMVLDVVPDPTANGDASPQLVLRPSEAG